jgi:hypothetical protein
MSLVEHLWINFVVMAGDASTSAEPARRRRAVHERTLAGRTTQWQTFALLITPWDWSSNWTN